MNAPARTPEPFTPTTPAGWQVIVEDQNDPDGALPSLRIVDPFGCEHSLRWHDPRRGFAEWRNPSISDENLAMMIAVGFEPQHGAPHWTPDCLRIAFEALPLYRQMAVMPPAPVEPKPPVPESERLRAVYTAIIAGLRQMTLGDQIIRDHQITYFSPTINSALTHQQFAADAFVKAGRLALGEIEP